MQNPTPAQVPLTADDKEWLMTIYRKRMQHLLTGYLFNLLFLTAIFFSRLGFVLQAMINDWFLGGKETWLVDQHFSSGWYIKIFIAMVICAVFCLLSYLFWIKPYRADIGSGIKVRIPFVVVKKEYFPVTDQYFVWIGKIDRRFEISKQAYDNCEEDGQIFMLVGPKSCYIFSIDDHADVY